MSAMDAEGYFHFYDRAKDLIKFKGLSIFAKDIEDVLYAHPQVKAAGASACRTRPSASASRRWWCFPRRSRRSDAADARRTPVRGSP
jgi:acyl-CoA synthetase (AMP-forming)/AMP-acid ligase II